MAREAGLVARGSFVLVLVALVAALLAAPAPAAAGGCPNADAKPGTVPPAKLRKAVLCLVNAARSDQGIDTLASNSDLDLIAQRHDRRMVRNDCFTHQCQGEKPLKRRFKRSAYVKGYSSFTYAEELGYETTPKEMVTRWLGSAPHRRNLVNATFTDLGIGVGRGAPVAGTPDAKFETYTLEFASRKK